MKWTLLFWIALAAAGLVRVNDKDFKDVVVGLGKYTLVDFYADWCRHCMKLMPTIEELGETYADVPDVQIVKINGDADGRKMSKKYSVPGYPHLLLFHGDDEPIEYEGLRDAELISNFIQQASGIRLGGKDEPVPYEIPSRVVSLNDANFSQAVHGANHKTVVAFTAPWCRYCEELKPAWTEMANRVYDSDPEVRFAVVDLSDDNRDKVLQTVAEYNVKTLPTVLLFNPLLAKDGKIEPLKYNDDRQLEFLIAFVNDNTGLSRNPEGTLFNIAGRVMALDEALVEMTEENAENFYALAQLLLDKFTEQGRDVLVNTGELFFKDNVTMAPYYVKVAQKIVAEGTQYVKNELARLERILAGDASSIERSALDYMQKRRNVLQELVRARKL